MPVPMSSGIPISHVARRLYQDALVWDDHCGFEPSPEADLEIVERWRAVGVDYLSICVGYDALTWQQTVKNLAAFITWFEGHSDRFVLVRLAEDVVKAKRDGRMAIAF